MLFGPQRTDYPYIKQEIRERLYAYIGGIVKQENGTTNNQSTAQPTAAQIPIFGLTGV